MALDRLPNFEVLQANIWPGFRRDYQAFLFARFDDDADAARRWLTRVAPKVTPAWSVARASADRHQPRQAPASGDPAGAWINVALSGHGLRTLDELRFSDLSEAFQQGIVKRARRVRDVPHVVRTWGVRDGPVDDDDQETDRIADALVLIAAEEEADLTAAVDVQTRWLDDLGLSQVELYRGKTLGDAREHFGFRDAVSQPAPDNPEIGWDWRNSDQIVAPGEFVLGCENELQAETNGPDWAANGSYLVFRRLRQDVDGFRDAMEAGARSLAAQGIRPMCQELLAAKVIGRWQSGARLEAGDSSDPFPDPTPKPPTQATQMTFQYLDDDKLGDGCPLFAHVRKANPRFVRAEVDISEDSPRFHRILRRGITYSADEGRDLGLLFVGYQADLERQFEHIQGQMFWSVSSPGATGVLAFANPGPDPLIGPSGDNEGNRRFFFHRRRAGSANTDFAHFNLQRFVRVTAGGYFFAPSIPALHALAENR